MIGKRSLEVDISHTTDCEQMIEKQGKPFHKKGETVPILVLIIFRAEFLVMGIVCSFLLTPFMITPIIFVLGWVAVAKVRNKTKKEAIRYFTIGATAYIAAVTLIFAANWLRLLG